MLCSNFDCASENARYVFIALVLVLTLNPVAIFLSPSFM